MPDGAARFFFFFFFFFARDNSIVHGKPPTTLRSTNKFCTKILHLHLFHLFKQDCRKVHSTYPATFLQGGGGGGGYKKERSIIRV